jgi:hypothetical protein
LQYDRNLGNDDATKTSTMQQKHKNFNNVLFLLEEHVENPLRT